MDYFLGIEVKTVPDKSILLTQSKYIGDLLQKTCMTEAQSISSPMASSCKLTKIGSDLFSDPTLYRSVIGAFQYLIITRPELSYSVNKVCQFMANLLESHWVAVKRILRYLKGTVLHGLHLRPAILGQSYSIRVLCDADWESHVDDRRLTSVAAVYFGPHLISWWSCKQQVVARSSTEAEYRSLAQITAKISWTQTLLTELKVPFSTPIVSCDNQSAVAIAHNLVFHAKTKHMELDLFFVRAKVLTKQLIVQHVQALDQRADALTKPLSPTRFAFLRTKLMLLRLLQSLNHLEFEGEY